MLPFGNQTYLWKCLFFSKGTAINPFKKWWIFKFAMLPTVSLLDSRFNDKTWLVLEAFYSAEVPNIQSHSYGFSEPNTSATNGWTVR